MAQFTPHQSDDLTACGAVALCSAPKALGLTVARTKLKRNAPIGSVPKSFSLQNGFLFGFQIGVVMQTQNLGSMGVSGIGEPGVKSWPAGLYTVRINITTANVNLAWRETFICRTAGAGVCGNLATVGSLLGQNISLGAVGVKVMTVSGALITPNENDQLYVVCVMSNSAVMSQSASMTPNQLFVTPISIPDKLRIMGMGT